MFEDAEQTDHLESLSNPGQLCGAIINNKLTLCLHRDKHKVKVQQVIFGYEQ